MLIIPAIDMKDHEVVRLKQGRMADSIVYGKSPVDMAGKWIDAGAKRIHLVDLNGAFEGKPCHFSEVEEIAKAYPGVPIEIGGGIRTLDTVQQYIDSGVSFCILGSAAVKNPSFLKEACKQFPQKIILGLDAKDGLVAIEGWDKVVQKKAVDFVEELAGLAMESVIYTDIAKDGMLQGMSVELIASMSKVSSFPIIASGGLTSLDDIKRLKTMNNIFGVIAGVALYENRFTLEDAIGEANAR